MQREAPRPGRPRSAVVVVCVLALYDLQCHKAVHHPVGEAEYRVGTVGAVTTAVGAAGRHARLATSNPLDLLKMCRRHCLAQVKDYHCLFIKQELVHGVMSPEQHIDVLYREDPYSVDMRWVKNPGPASRVNYVAGRWVSGEGELALIHPSGVLGLLVPGGVKRDIHGPPARAASRRSIDQFGFRNSLDLIIKYCELAEGEPGYSLRYVGGGTLDGRPCYVIERRLPYTGEDGRYPDRLLVVYIDHEWLVPTGCFAYADDAGQELLGSYVSIAVEFNTGLSDEDF